MPPFLARSTQTATFPPDYLLGRVLFRDAMMHVAKEHGRDLPLSVFLRMVGLPGPVSRLVAIEHFGKDFPIDTYNDAVWAHARRLHDEIGMALKAGVVELLDYLDDLNLPRAVATSSQAAISSWPRMSPNGHLAPRLPTARLRH